ncbi:MAG: Ig-like domain-containing protein [bacterium]
MNKHSTFAVAALLAIVASCGTHKGDAAKIGETNTGSTAAQRPPATLESFDPVDPSVTGQMDMAASNGVAQSEDVGSLARPEVKPLEQSAIDKILARLSPLQVETTDKKDFAVRGRSMPPPKTGETITTTFPPASDLKRPDAVAVKPGPLQVLRYAPDGDIPVAPKLSVTFDQPMVEITSHKDTIANGVPVKLTPTPEGQWRWIGSKTLLFEPTTEHMPMATEYSVTIPAGTKSKTEGTLEKEVAFTFRTPTVTLQQYFPSSGPVKLDQPIFLGFDQNINPIDMLEHIEVRAGNRVIPIKMADQKTIDADPTIKSYVDQAVAGRYVVVVPSMEMPYNTSIRSS